MGQGHSAGGTHSTTPDELSHLLSTRFAKKCFTDIELYSFKDVFKSLADDHDGILYWSEDTMARFLALPDALEVSPLIFQASTFLGAFPFLFMAPSILTYDAMIRVVAIFTRKYTIIMKGKHDAAHLIFRSISEYDRGVGAKPGFDEKAATAPASQIINSSTEDDTFVIGDDDEEEDDDDDEMALAALDALDAIEVFKHSEKPEIKFVRKISVENMTRIVMLLLVTAPLDAQESLALYVERYSADALPALKKTAENIVRSMSLDGRPIQYRSFSKSVNNSLPYLFDGFKPLFEHFLFSKTVSGHTAKEQGLVPPLLKEPGTIMDHNVLSQLAFFLKGENLWRRMRKLYVGSQAGFSMGSFEQKVFKWQAPTILVVSGTRMSDPPESSREKSFTDRLAPKRYADGVNVDNSVVFGAYIHSPWKTSTRECFGSVETKLFQLAPYHEVFETSTSYTDYAYFNKLHGIGFGSPLQQPKSEHLSLGAVSLVLDEGLEFGVFNHSSAGGGAFRPGARGDWQDRFEIEEVEVWGVGGIEEAQEQAKQWAWEEREALSRRGLNGGNDVEANRAILEMAGIIGGNRSGGSI